MALTIKQLTNYSWMSQASYLDFSGLIFNDPRLASNLKNSSINADKILADAQASTFTDPTDGFSFVSYAPNYLDTARVGRTRLQCAA
ncbi:MAG: hypothetical protein Q8R74_06040 [Methylophilus sp.]|nr:hypothetical protein [Methylophilus sp.]